MVNEAGQLSHRVLPSLPRWQRPMGGGKCPRAGRVFEQVGGLLPSGFHMVKECVVPSEPPHMLSMGEKAGLLHMAAVSPRSEVWP